MKLDYIGYYLTGNTPADAQVVESTGNQFTILDKEAAWEKYQQLIPDRAVFDQKYAEAEQSYDKYKTGNFISHVSQPRFIAPNSVNKTLFGFTSKLSELESIDPVSQQWAKDPNGKIREIATPTTIGASHGYYIDKFGQRKNYDEKGWFDILEAVPKDDTYELHEKGWTDSIDWSNAMGIWGPQKINPSATRDSVSALTSLAGWGGYLFTTDEILEDIVTGGIQYAKQAIKGEELKYDETKPGMSWAFTDRKGNFGRNIANFLSSGDRQPENILTTKNVVSSLGQALSNMLMYTGYFAVTGGNPVAAGVLTAGTMSAMAGGMMVDTAKQAGLNDFQASLIFAPSAAVTFATEQLLFSSNVVERMLLSKVLRSELQAISKGTKDAVTKSFGKGLAELSETEMEQASKMFANGWKQGLKGLANRVPTILREVGESNKMGQVFAATTEETLEEMVDAIGQNSIQATFDLISPLFDSKAAFGTTYADILNGDIIDQGILGGIGGFGASVFVPFHKKVQAEKMMQLGARYKGDMTKVKEELKKMYEYGLAPKHKGPEGIVYEGKGNPSWNDVVYGELLNEANLVEAMYKDAGLQGLQDLGNNSKVSGDDMYKVAESLVEKHLEYGRKIYENKSKISSAKESEKADLQKEIDTYQAIQKQIWDKETKTSQVFDRHYNDLRLIGSKTGFNADKYKAFIGKRPSEKNVDRYYGYGNMVDSNRIAREYTQKEIEANIQKAEILKEGVSWLDTRMGQFASLVDKHPDKHADFQDAGIQKVWNEILTGLEVLGTSDDLFSKRMDFLYAISTKLTDDDIAHLKDIELVDEDGEQYKPKTGDSYYRYKEIVQDRNYLSPASEEMHLSSYVELEKAFKQITNRTEPMTLPSETDLFADNYLFLYEEGLQDGKRVAFHKGKIGTKLDELQRVAYFDAQQNQELEKIKETLDALDMYADAEMNVLSGYDANEQKRLSPEHKLMTREEYDAVKRDISEYRTQAEVIDTTKASLESKSQKFMNRKRINELYLKYHYLSVLFAVLNIDAANVAQVKEKLKDISDIDPKTKAVLDQYEEIYYSEHDKIGDDQLNDTKQISEFFNSLFTPMEKFLKAGLAGGIRNIYPTNEHASYTPNEILDFYQTGSGEAPASHIAWNALLFVKSFDARMTLMAKAAKKAFDEISFVEADTPAGKLKTFPKDKYGSHEQQSVALTIAPLIVKGARMSNAIEAMRTIFKTLDADILHNTIQVAGDPGTGKTMVMPNLLLSMHKNYHGSKPKVHLIVSNPDVYREMTDKLSGADVVSHSTVTSIPDLTNVDFVILDEFSYLPPDIANNLKTVFENFHGYVLVTGDEKQSLYREERPGAMINTLMPVLYDRIIKTPPLKWKFRANNIPLWNIQQKFIQSSGVQIGFKLYFDQTTYDDGAGTQYFADKEDVLKAFLADPEEDKVIIPTTAYDAINLKNKVPAALKDRVIPVEWNTQIPFVQGRSFKKVYVYINPSEGDGNYTRNMYTAVSRATEYVALPVGQEFISKSEKGKVVKIENPVGFFHSEYDSVNERLKTISRNHGSPKGVKSKVVEISKLFKKRTDPNDRRYDYPGSPDGIPRQQHSDSTGQEYESEAMKIGNIAESILREFIEDPNKKAEEQTYEGYVIDTNSIQQVKKVADYLRNKYQNAHIMHEVVLGQFDMNDTYPPKTIPTEAGTTDIYIEGENFAKIIDVKVTTKENMTAKQMVSNHSKQLIGYQTKLRSTPGRPDTLENPGLIIFKGKATKTTTTNNLVLELIDPDQVVHDYVATTEKAEPPVREKTFETVSDPSYRGDYSEERNFSGLYPVNIDTSSPLRSQAIADYLATHKDAIASVDIEADQLVIFADRASWEAFIDKAYKSDPVLRANTKLGYVLTSQSRGSKLDIALETLAKDMPDEGIQIKIRKFKSFIFQIAKNEIPYDQMKLLAEANGLTVGNARIGKNEKGQQTVDLEFIDKYGTRMPFTVRGRHITTADQKIALEELEDLRKDPEILAFLEGSFKKGDPTFIPAAKVMESSLAYKLIIGNYRSLNPDIGILTSPDGTRYSFSRNQEGYPEITYEKAGQWYKIFGAKGNGVKNGIDHLKSVLPLFLNNLTVQKNRQVEIKPVTARMHLKMTAHGFVENVEDIVGDLGGFKVGRFYFEKAIAKEGYGAMAMRKDIENGNNRVKMGNRLQARALANKLFGSKADTLFRYDSSLDNVGKWGEILENGNIVLNDKNGNVNLYAVRHEAMHYLIDFLLTPQERNQILEEARQILGQESPGPFTTTQLHEFLAEAYQGRYEGITGFIRNMLDYIRTVLKNWGLYKADYRTMMYELEHGVYANRSPGSGYGMSYDMAYEAYDKTVVDDTLYADPYKLTRIFGGVEERTLQAKTLVWNVFKNTIYTPWMVRGRTYHDTFELSNEANINDILTARAKLLKEFSDAGYSEEDLIQMMEKTGNIYVPIPDAHDKYVQLMLSDMSVYNGLMRIMLPGYNGSVKAIQHVVMNLDESVEISSSNREFVNLARMIQFDDKTMIDSIDTMNQMLKIMITMTPYKTGRGFVAAGPLIHAINQVTASWQYYPGTTNEEKIFAAIKSLTVDRTNKEKMFTVNPTEAERFLEYWGEPNTEMVPADDMWLLTVWDYENHWERILAEAQKNHFTADEIAMLEKKRFQARFLKNGLVSELQSKTLKNFTEANFSKKIPYMTRPYANTIDDVMKAHQKALFDRALNMGINNSVGISKSLITLINTLGYSSDKGVITISIGGKPVFSYDGKAYKLIGSSESVDALLKSIGVDMHYSAILGFMNGQGKNRRGQLSPTRLANALAAFTFSSIDTYVKFTKNRMEAAKNAKELDLFKRLQDEIKKVSWYSGSTAETWLNKEVKLGNIVALSEDEIESKQEDVTVEDTSKGEEGGDRIIAPHMAVRYLRELASAELAHGRAYYSRSWRDSSGGRRFSHTVGSSFDSMMPAAPPNEDVSVHRKLKEDYKGGVYDTAFGRHPAFDLNVPYEIDKRYAFVGETSKRQGNRMSEMPTLDAIRSFFDAAFIGDLFNSVGKKTTARVSLPAHLNGDNSYYSIHEYLFSNNSKPWELTKADNQFNLTVKKELFRDYILKTFGVYLNHRDNAIMNTNLWMVANGIDFGLNQIMSPSEIFEKYRVLALMPNYRMLVKRFMATAANQGLMDNLDYKIKRFVINGQEMDIILPGQTMMMDFYEATFDDKTRTIEYKAENKRVYTWDNWQWLLSKGEGKIKTDDIIELIKPTMERLTGAMKTFGYQMNKDVLNMNGFGQYWSRKPVFVPTGQSLVHREGGKAGTINFTKEELGGYAKRTRQTAKGDLTVAIAKDFTTPGELLTQSQAKGRYLQVPYGSENVTDIVKRIRIALQGKEGITVNIAGNEISKLGIGQKDVDDYVYKLFSAVSQSLTEDEKKRISFISGGQSGIDEAGAKATSLLGFDTTVHAPADWSFQNSENKKITGENNFKARFLPGGWKMEEEGYFDRSEKVFHPAIELFSLLSHMSVQDSILIGLGNELQYGSSEKFFQRTKADNMSGIVPNVDSKLGPGRYSRAVSLTYGASKVQVGDRSLNLTNLKAMVLNGKMKPEQAQQIWDSRSSSNEIKHPDIARLYPESTGTDKGEGNMVIHDLARILFSRALGSQYGMMALHGLDKVGNHFVDHTTGKSFYGKLGQVVFDDRVREESPFAQLIFELGMGPTLHKMYQDQRSSGKSHLASLYSLADAISENPALRDEMVDFFYLPGSVKTGMINTFDIQDFDFKTMKPRINHDLVKAGSVNLDNTGYRVILDYKTGYGENDGVFHAQAMYLIALSEDPKKAEQMYQSQSEIIKMVLDDLKNQIEKQSFNVVAKEFLKNASKYITSATITHELSQLPEIDVRASVQMLVQSLNMLANHLTKNGLRTKISGSHDIITTSHGMLVYPAVYDDTGTFIRWGKANDRETQFWVAHGDLNKIGLKPEQLQEAGEYATEYEDIRIDSGKYRKAMYAGKFQHVKSFGLNHRSTMADVWFYKPLNSQQLYNIRTMSRLRLKSMLHDIVKVAASDPKLVLANSGIDYEMTWENIELVLNTKDNPLIKTALGIYKGIKRKSEINAGVNARLTGLPKKERADAEPAIRREVEKEYKQKRLTWTNKDFNNFFRQFEIQMDSFIEVTENVTIGRVPSPKSSMTSVGFMVTMVNSLNNTHFASPESHHIRDDDNDGDVAYKSHKSIDGQNYIITEGKTGHVNDVHEKLTKFYTEAGEETLKSFVSPLIKKDVPEIIEASGLKSPVEIISDDPVSHIAMMSMGNTGTEIIGPEANSSKAIAMAALVNDKTGKNYFGLKGINYHVLTDVMADNLQQSLDNLKILTKAKMAFFVPNVNLLASLLYTHFTAGATSSRETFIDFVEFISKPWVRKILLDNAQLNMSLSRKSEGLPFILDRNIKYYQKRLKTATEISLKSIEDQIKELSATDQDDDLAYSISMAWKRSDETDASVFIINEKERIEEVIADLKLLQKHAARGEAIFRTSVIASLGQNLNAVPYNLATTYTNLQNWSGLTNVFDGEPIKEEREFFTTGEKEMTKDQVDAENKRLKAIWEEHEANVKAEMSIPDLLRIPHIEQSVRAFLFVHEQAEKNSTQYSKVILGRTDSYQSEVKKNAKVDFLYKNEWYKMVEMIEQHNDVMFLWMRMNKKTGEVNGNPVYEDDDVFKWLDTVVLPGIGISTLATFYDGQTIMTTRPKNDPSRAFFNWMIPVVINKIKNKELMGELENNLFINSVHVSGQGAGQFLYIPGFQFFTEEHKSELQRSFRNIASVPNGELLQKAIALYQISRHGWMWRNDSIAPIIPADVYKQYSDEFVRYLNQFKSNGEVKTDNGNASVGYNPDKTDWDLRALFDGAGSHIDRGVDLDIVLRLPDHMRPKFFTFPQKDLKGITRDIPGIMTEVERKGEIIKVPTKNNILTFSPFPQTDSMFTGLQIINRIDIDDTEAFLNGKPVIAYTGNKQVQDGAAIIMGAFRGDATHQPERKSTIITKESKTRLFGPPLPPVMNGAVKQAKYGLMWHEFMYPDTEEKFTKHMKDSGINFITGEAHGDKFWLFRDSEQSWVIINAGKDFRPLMLTPHEAAIYLGDSYADTFDHLANTLEASSPVLRQPVSTKGNNWMTSVMKNHATNEELMFYTFLMRSREQTKSTTVNLVSGIDNTISGYAYYDTKLGSINIHTDIADAIINSWGAKHVTQTILHELTHADLSTRIQLFLDGKYDQLSEKDLAALRDLNRLYNNAYLQTQNKHLYGYKDFHEFVSESLSSKEFREDMRNMALPEGMSIWDKVKVALKILIRSIFPEGSKYLNAVDGLIFTLIDSDGLSMEGTSETAMRLNAAALKVNKMSDLVNYIGDNTEIKHNNKKSAVEWMLSKWKTSSKGIVYWKTMEMHWGVYQKSLGGSRTKTEAQAVAEAEKAFEDGLKYELMIQGEFTEALKSQDNLDAFIRKRGSKLSDITIREVASYYMDWEPYYKFFLYNSDQSKANGYHSPLFDASDVGFNPVITWHTPDGALNGKQEISITDITSNNLAGYNKSMFDFLGITTPTFDKSERGIRAFFLTLTAMSVMKKNPTVRIRRVGSIKMSGGLTTNFVYLPEALKDLKRLRENKDFMNSLSDEMKQIINDDALYNPHLYDQSYLWQIQQMYKNYSPEEKQKNYIADLLVRKIQDAATEKDELADIIKHRLGRMAADYEAGQLFEVKEAELLMGSLHELEQKKMTGFNSMRDMGEFDARYLESAGGAANDIVQFAYQRMIISLGKSKEEFDQFRRVHDPMLKELNDIFYASHQVHKFTDVLTENQSLKFEPLFRKREIGREQVKTLEIWWDENDQDTKEAIANGTIHPDRETALKYVRYGKYVADTIWESLVQLEMHQIEEYSFGKNKQQRIAETRLKAENIVNNKYTRGIIPAMGMDAVELFVNANRKNVKETMKQVWSRFTDTMVNPEYIYTHAGSAISNMRMGEGFAKQFKNDAEYGSDYRLELMGLSRTANGLTVTDKARNQRLTYDMEIIMNYFQFAVKSKINFEKMAMHEINSAKGILYNYNRSKGIQQKWNLQFLKEWDDRIHHGKLEQSRNAVTIEEVDASGMSFDKTMNLMVAATTFGQMAWNVSSAMTMSMVNSISLVNTAVSNPKTSHWFTMENLANAVLLYIRNPKLVHGISRMYKFADWDRNMLLNSAKHSPTKRKIFNSYWFQYLNWLPDYISRNLVGIAQMDKDGVLAAHSVDKDGFASFDESKVEKWKSGKGKKIRDMKYEELILEGIQERGKPMIRAYTILEQDAIKDYGANNVVGGYESTEQSNMVYERWPRIFSTYKKYWPSRIKNLHSHERYRGTMMYVDTEEIENPDGTKEDIAVYRRDLMEGKIQSIRRAYIQIKNAKEAGLSYHQAYAALPDRSKHNLSRLSIDTFLMLVNLLAVSLSGDDDDDKKKIGKYNISGGFVFNNRFLRSISYALQDGVVEWYAPVGLRLFTEPFPVITHAWRWSMLLEAMLTWNMSKAAQYSKMVIPGGSNIRLISDLIED